MWGVIIIIALIVCVVFAARELFAIIDEADFNESYDDKHDKGVSDER